MAPTPATADAGGPVRPPSDAEVLAECQVPETPSVFVLGCLEERVTLYSQQVRALNLVGALLNTGVVQSKSTVAIIGGGAAGLTAAAALISAVPDLKALDVYERMPDVLHLQTASPHRYLHPHLYDWPAEGTLRTDAGLPLLDWSAGTAENVAKELSNGFSEIQDRHPLLRVKREHHVERVHGFPLGGCRVLVSGNPLAGGTYNVAILSIGFGNERLTDGGENRSYWDASHLSAPFRGRANEYRVLVSGNGDGGLVDFYTAAFSGKSQKEICDYITSRTDLEAAKRVLLEIEAEAWQPDARIDIYTEYKNKLPAVLPSGIWFQIDSMLRHNAEVVLHTREPHLFRTNTAILNRFITYLALAADQNVERYALRVALGVELSGTGLEPTVVLRDGQRIKPTYRCLRFGPDKESNFEPFSEHIDAVKTAKAAQVPSSAGPRPATPRLSASAQAWFARRGAATTPGPPDGSESSAEVMPSPVDIVIRIGLASDGLATWHSSFSASDVSRVWAENAGRLILTCDMSPDEAGPLRFVIARLVAHTRNYRLFCRNSHSWIDFLRGFVGTSRPAPGVEIRFKVLSIPENVEVPEPTDVVSKHELASRVHLSLDFDILARLNSAVTQALSASSAVSAGWRIEGNLRRLMLSRWYAWHEKLLLSEAKRRRYLVLLAHPDDEADVGPHGMVRVGPKCVESVLLRATLLALSFATCTDADVTPAASFPGNLVGEKIAGHAVGVSWLDGVDVGPEAVTRRWSTNLVLLSELRDAAFVHGRMSRLDRRDDAAPGRTQVPGYEQPMLVGCDHRLQTALRGGESTVREFFDTLLRERARAAQAMLEKS